MKEIQRYKVFRMARTIQDKVINAVGQLLVPVKSDDGDIVFYTDHLAAIEEERRRMMRFAEWQEDYYYFADYAGTLPILKTIEDKFQYWSENVENKGGKK